MMNRRLHRLPVAAFVLAALVAVVTLSGCDLSNDEEGAQVTVMTRNLYLGADIFKVVGAPSSNQVPPLVAQVFQTVLESDFATRAQALADEIEAARPHLVGLQEVSLFRTQAPSDYVNGNTAPNAADVAVDFLDVLTAELDARGLGYRVAVQVQNADIEVPAAESASSFFDVRLTDRDVILVRDDVEVAAPGQKNFDLNLEIGIPAGDPDAPVVSFQRGYVWLEAAVDGVPFTFVNTHLEVGTLNAELEALQLVQVSELTQRFAGGDAPVVLVGDFNTGPGATATPYDALVARFTDAFTAAGAAGDGFTCCQAEDVRNATSQLDQRIDLILYGGDVTVEDVDVVGEESGDRIEGLWPSDHAGVVATLEIR